MEKIEIETDRLLIRSYSSEYLAALFEYRKSEEVSRYLSFQPESIQELDKIFENTLSDKPFQSDWYQLIVFEKPGRKVLGDIVFKLVAPGKAEIGYCFHPVYQGRGFAFEAVKSLIDFLYKNKVSSIQAETDPQNLPSIKLLVKLGFEKKEERTKDVFLQGRWCDTSIFIKVFEA